MFCGQCGNNVSDSAKFCSKCGWKVPGGNDMPSQNDNNQVMVSATQGGNGMQGDNLQSQQAGQQNTQVDVADSAPVAVAPVAGKPKKKSKLWLWILLIVLVLGLGAGGTWAYFTYFASEEEDDDDEDDRDDEDDDEEDADDKKSKKPSKKDKTKDCDNIAEVMDAIEITACDPSISWYNGEVVYVQFTSEGAFYGCDSTEVVTQMNNIVLAEDVCVSAWANGFEMWAKKDPSTGIVYFSTSWDYDEMADVSEPLARRFNMTSVEP